MERGSLSTNTLACCCSFSFSSGGRPLFGKSTSPSYPTSIQLSIQMQTVSLSTSYIFAISSTLYLRLLNNMLCALILTLDDSSSFINLFSLCLSSSFISSINLVGIFISCTCLLFWCSHYTCFLIHRNLAIACTRSQCRCAPLGRVMLNVIPRRG